jgi:hypothetical protein
MTLVHGFLSLVQKRTKHRDPSKEINKIPGQEDWSLPWVDVGCPGKLN